MKVRDAVFGCLFLGALFARPFAEEYVPKEPVREEPLRLLCEYTHTIDEQGRSMLARGEKLITAQQNENGIATIKKENFDEEFSGSITDEEIRGQVAYRLHDGFVTETVFINRYSGRLVGTVEVSHKTVLTQFGKCRSATAKLF